jgi:hypothetical protein
MLQILCAHAEGAWREIGAVGGVCFVLSMILNKVIPVLAPAATLGSSFSAHHKPRFESNVSDERLSADLVFPYWIQYWHRDGNHK